MYVKTVTIDKTGSTDTINDHWLAFDYEYEYLDCITENRNYFIGTILFCPFFIKQHFSGILCLSNKHYDRGKRFYLSFLWYVTSYCQLLEICFKCRNHRIFVHNYLRVLSNVWATRWLLCTFSRMSIEQDGVRAIVTIFLTNLRSIVTFLT